MRGSNIRSIAATTAGVVILIGAVALSAHPAGFVAAGNGTLSRIATPSPSRSTAVPSLSPSPITSKSARPKSSPSSSARTFRAGAKPVAGNTGVVPGTALTVVSGNKTYGSGANGQTITGKDFHGFVRVTGAGITFRDCIFRGGTPTGNNALFDTSDSPGPVTVTDSEFVPAHPAATIDGLWLKNTTVLRADVHGSVDGIKADSHSVIRDSYIHDMQYFASDPNQDGGDTHNDAIQILNGSDITIDGNNLATGGQSPNSAIQITQGFGPVSDVVITNNWADYGGCTFNFAHQPLGRLSIGPVTGNRFGRHQGYQGCAIVISTKTTLVKNSGNVWADTGDPIPAPQQHD